MLLEKDILNIIKEYNNLKIKDIFIFEKRDTILIILQNNYSKTIKCDLTIVINDDDYSICYELFSGVFEKTKKRYCKTKQPNYFNEIRTFTSNVDAFIKEIEILINQKDSRT